MYKRKRNIAVFTDTWDFGVYDAKVPENGLLPGELSAVTFRVGCYIVRSALRAYRCHKVGDILEKQGQVPASQAELAAVRNDLYFKKFIEPIKTGSFPAEENLSELISSVPLPFWRNELCIRHEISAKHIGWLDKEFSYICSAVQYINSGVLELSCGTNAVGSYEYIGDIYSMTEQEKIPDESGALLIFKHFENSCQSIDTWYRFDPAGKITISSEAPVS